MVWEATGKAELGMRTERVPDLNELLNFPWVRQSTSPAEATNKRHSTMAFKSHQFSYFWWAKEKNIEFPSESGTLLGVNVSCFDILR